MNEGEWRRVCAGQLQTFGDWRSAKGVTNQSEGTACLTDPSPAGSSQVGFWLVRKIFFFPHPQTSGLSAFTILFLSPDFFSVKIKKKIDKPFVIGFFVVT